jgi:c-di-GMP-related signal transduction protein
MESWGLTALLCILDWCDNYMKENTHALFQITSIVFFLRHWIKPQENLVTMYGELSKSQSRYFQSDFFLTARALCV